MIHTPAWRWGKWHQSRRGGRTRETDKLQPLTIVGYEAEDSPRICGKYHRVSPTKSGFRQLASDGVQSERAFRRVETHRIGFCSCSACSWYRPCPWPMIQNLCPCKWLLRREGCQSSGSGRIYSQCKKVADSQWVVAVVEATAAAMKQLSAYRNRKKRERRTCLLYTTWTTCVSSASGTVTTN